MLRQQVERFGGGGSSEAGRFTAARVIPCSVPSDYSAATSAKSARSIAGAATADDHGAASSPTTRAACHAAETKEGAVRTTTVRGLPRVTVNGVTFTGREWSIAELAAEGYLQKQIGYNLGITEGTVKVYMCRLYSKMRGVHPEIAGMNMQVMLSNWVRYLQCGRTCANPVWAKYYQCIVNPKIR